MIMEMQKFFMFFAILGLGWASAQRSNIQKKIDSLYQQRWYSTAIDMDSLANPQLLEITTHHRDTIVIADEVVVPPAPEDIPITPFNLVNWKEPKRWFFFGQNNLIFNQSSFSNWNSGGNNNLGIIGKINYNLSYKRDYHYLENILQLGYGFVATKGQSSRKTEDYINLMTNYGYELGRNYYISTGFQFLSQFTPGYNYGTTPDPNYGDRVSRFMAPGYLNVGLGISYNPNENFQVIFRPANGKFTFVLDPKLQQKGRYGLERDGQSVRSELGAMLNLLYRLNIYKDINLVNQLNFFSNYLYHAERVDINYSGVLNMRFNRYISGVVGVDLVYDHDQVKRLQVKQTLGVGFTYNIGGADLLPKNSSKKTIKPFIAK